jgi:hypothetical protein
MITVERARRESRSGQCVPVRRKWFSIFDGLGPPITMELAFDRYRRFVERPTHAEARFFGDLVTLAA